MLVWNPSLELGVRVLDTHHRRLVDMANEVFAIVKAGAPQADVLKKLRELADFAAWHFRFEEDLMAETAYQDGTPSMESSTANFWASWSGSSSG